MGELTGVLSKEAAQRTGKEWVSLSGLAEEKGHGVTRAVTDDMVCWWEAHRGRPRTLCTLSWCLGGAM